MWQDSNTFSLEQREAASARARELNEMMAKFTMKHNGPINGPADVSTKRIVRVSLFGDTKSIVSFSSL